MRRPTSPRAWRSPSAASGLALLLAGGRSGRPPLILSATALGFAISGMHYTAMAGLTVMPHGGMHARARPRFPPICSPSWWRSSPSSSPAFSCCTLVPDRKPATAARRGGGHRAAGAPHASATRNRRAPRRPRSDVRIADDELGHGTYAAARRHRRSARAHRAPASGRARRHDPFRPGPRHRRGSRQRALHLRFRRHAKLFCPLPIGDVESRLDQRPLRPRPPQPHRQPRTGGRAEAAPATTA